MMHDTLAAASYRALVKALGIPDTAWCGLLGLRLIHGEIDGRGKSFAAAEKESLSAGLSLPEDLYELTTDDGKPIRVCCRIA